MSNNSSTNNNDNGHNIQQITMNKYLKTSDKYVMAIDAGDPASLEMVVGRGRLGIFSKEPDASKGLEKMDFQKYLKEVKELETQVKSQLVAMETPIHMAMLGLMTGDNVFFLSLPGAAKTTLTKKIAEGINGDFFRKNFTPDMSAADLFGPPSVKGAQEGKWTRMWSGLTTATVAMLDEFYKGGHAIQSNVLDIAEERTVSDPHKTHNTPLLLMIGASNEVAGEDPRNATWDRWMYRMEVAYPSKPQDVLSALTSAGGRRPITVKLDPCEIALAQSVVEYHALNLPSTIQNQMAEIIVELNKLDINPSPRRWMGWARAIVAEAFMSGRGTPDSEDLMIGEHILWIQRQSRDKIVKVIGGKSSPERAIIMSILSAIEETRSYLKKGEVTAEEVTKKTVRFAKYQQKLEREVKDPKFEQDKLHILNEITNLKVEMMDCLAANQN